MKPIFKYHSIILSITISAMYVLFTLVTSVRANLPEVPKLLEAVFTLIFSVGIYKLASSLLNFSLLHSRHIKKLVHGNEYLHGTWIGFFYGNGGDKRTYVEYFEQDLESLTIRGSGYKSNGEFFSQWISEPVTIESRKGRLIYSYTSDVFSRNETRQGLGVFHFTRSNINKAPNELKGYVVDLDKGKRLPSEEWKISDELLPISDALERARNLQ